MTFGDILTYTISLFILISPYFLKGKFSEFDIMSLVRSFGVFGTFLGILLGLINFNTSDIEGSVPLLLSGLKTAFLTSLAGLSTSMIIKMFPKVYGFKPGDEEEEDEVAQVLENEGLNDNEKVVLLLTEIRKAILDGSSKSKKANSKLDQIIKQLANSTAGGAIVQAGEGGRSVGLDANSLKSVLQEVQAGGPSQSPGKVAELSEKNTKTFKKILDEVGKMRDKVSNIPGEKINLLEEITKRLEEIKDEISENNNKSQLLEKMVDSINNANTDMSTFKNDFEKLKKNHLSFVEEVKEELLNLSLEIKKINPFMNPYGAAAMQQPTKKKKEEENNVIQIVLALLAIAFGLAFFALKDKLKGLF